MRTRYFPRAAAALAGLALLLAAAPAWAVLDPIPGVDVIVKKNGLAVAATTDAGGNAVLGQLPPGPCVVVLGGKSLKRLFDGGIFGFHFGGAKLVSLSVEHDGMTDGTQTVSIDGSGRNVSARFVLPADKAAPERTRLYSATLTLLK